MRSFILAAIRFYQRYISPKKGFCCAYRIHTGRSSCSVLGYRAIHRYGAWAGLLILRERLYLCGVSHRRYTPAPIRHHAKQRGDCDIGGCDSCDGFDSCDFPDDAPCDTSGCNQCNRCDSCNRYNRCNRCSGCSLPGRKRTPRDQEKSVYIPPRRTR